MSESPTTLEAQLAALKREKAGYEKYGHDDRAAQVDDAIKSLSKLVKDAPREDSVAGQVTRVSDVTTIDAPPDAPTATPPAAQADAPTPPAKKTAAKRAAAKRAASVKKD